MLRSRSGRYARALREYSGFCAFNGAVELLQPRDAALGQLARTAATVSLSWVTTETGLTLQQTDLLGTPTGWSDTTNSVSINGLTNVIQQAPGTANRFFRLHRP